MEKLVERREFIKPQKTKPNYLVSEPRSQSNARKFVGLLITCICQGSQRSETIEKVPVDFVIIVTKETLRAFEATCSNSRDPIGWWIYNRCLARREMERLRQYAQCKNTIQTSGMRKRINFLMRQFPAKNFMRNKTNITTQHLKKADIFLDSCKRNKKKGQAKENTFLTKILFYSYE